MVRSKFPGKPTKHSSRTRVNVLSGPLNNNNNKSPSSEQTDVSDNNIVGDATTNQDETIVAEDRPKQQHQPQPAGGAESDLMRVRLTRASFVGEQALLQCNGQGKRGRRIRPAVNSAAESKAVGKFVLPSRSAHSSRVIKPNKRFITVDSIEIRKKSYKTRVVNKRQQCKCIVQGGLKKRTRIPTYLNTITEGSSMQAEAAAIVKMRKTRKVPTGKSNGREEAAGMTTRNRIVLRQARLKIKSPSGIGASPSRGGPFSNGNKPGTITCGVCLIPRFFNKRTFLQRDRFNIYSCEACSNFIVAMAQQNSPSEVLCRRVDGKCYEVKAEVSTEPRGRSMRNKSIPSPLKRLHRSSTVRRCRACWLKICLRAFQMPMALRASLTKMLPAHMQENNLFGGTVSLPAHFLNTWYAQAKQSTSSTPMSDTDASPSSSHHNVPTNHPEFSPWPPLPSSTPSAARKLKCKLPTQPTRQRYHRVARDKIITPATTSVAETSASSGAPIVVPAIPLMDAAVKRQKIDLKGPRVKHVCRSASIVLGLNVATFPPKPPVAPASTDSDSELEVVAAHADDLAEVLVVEEAVQTQPPVVDEDEEGLSPLPKFVESVPSPPTIDEQESVLDITTPPKIPSVSCAVIPIVSCAVIPKPIDPPAEDTDETKEPIVAISVRSELVENPLAVSTLAPITKKEKKAILTSQLDVQYFAPTRKFNTNVPAKPKNVLSIDFWETYDFEEVCRNGFSLTGTAPFPVQAICFLCGSAGMETLLHCCLCCEPYHPYCLEQTPPLFRQPDDRFSWLCPRCTTCTACGHADRQKINCQKCHNTYHPQCFNTKWRTDDRPTVCSNCLRCKSCGTDNITKFVGNLALCLLCFKLRNKGNFCPLCQRCYDDNDFDTKMMECGKCNKWVHSKCEGLTDEQYQILSILPESVEYLCCLCSTEATPYWRKAIQAELKNSFNTILCLLNKNQIARPMLKLTPVKGACANISTPKFPPTSCNVAKRILFCDENICDPVIDDEMICAAKIESKRNSSSSDSSGVTLDMPSTPNITDIKRKINCNEYFSLRDFNNGMETALRTNCPQSKQLLEIYHNVLRKVFPWFDPAIEESPAMDMSFAADVSKLDINMLERDKKFDYESYAVLIESEKPILETRVCSLCKGLGDGNPQKEARLLYCGHNEWIHGNCALWSSEVYEEIDGSLQNVHGAINRGKSIKCTLCKLRGASIGCCQKGCSESYHFICAQKADCQFMADKSIYCKHHDTTDLNSSATIDFDIRRSIYVELDIRKKKYIESYKVNYIVGSLSVLNLGLVAASVSDTVDAIIPTSFVCSRLFWSTKSPWQLVPYVIRTSVLKATSKTIPVDKNFTVDHSQPKVTVDRKLKELSSWLKDEKDVLTLAEFDDEEEPQNTADILSPELTDAILQELPHGLLDGLMNMDFKNSEININDLNNGKVTTDLLDMDLKRPSGNPIQQPRSCSLRLSCKLNSPAMKKRKTQPAPPRENVYLHLLVDGPCDSSSGSECDSSEPAAVIFDDDDEEEEDYRQEIASIMHEQPVTCDRCNCTYRTQASYSRHLDGCSDPIFTSESDSEEQNHPQHMIMCPATQLIPTDNGTTIVLNVEKKSTTMPTLLGSSYETYSFVPQSDATALTEYINQQVGGSTQQSADIYHHQQSPQKSSILSLPQSPPQDLSFSQSPTFVVASSNSDDSQFTLPLNAFNLSINQLPLTLQSIGHQDIVLQASQPQITIDAKLINQLNSEQSNQNAWGVNVKPIKSPRAQYITARKTQQASPPTQQTLLVQQPTSCPTQVYIQSLPTNGQLVSVPTFVDSNGSLINTGNQMQYVTTAPAQQSAPTTLLQLHQSTADGNYINLVPNIQSTPVYSIHPQTARLEGGQIVVDNNGSMLWTTSASAPATAAPVGQSAGGQPGQAPTQPLFYGFETIVQNTVMQSQQFLPTAMPGVLSSNSSYSTTTQNSFQVFQTSKLEPVLDMSHGGFVFVNNNTPSTPTQPTILNTTATYSPQEGLIQTSPPQLSFIQTPQQQNVAFAEQQQLQLQQQPPPTILRTIKTEPFESFEQSPEQQSPAPQQLLLAKVPRQQTMVSKQQQQLQQAMVELTVQTSQDFCNKLQQIPDVKPIVARAAAIPMTYSPKSTIKHRPISRVLPMPTNPVKKLDLGPQQYRSKTVKKSATITNAPALQTIKPNVIVEKMPDNVLEVIKQNEEIARVKQEIIRAKEEIIKAKQEIVKTKEIIISPQEVLMDEPFISRVIHEEIVISSMSTLAMPSASSPQLLEPPILPPLAVNKMDLGSPKRECLLEDVRKAAQNTFPEPPTEKHAMLVEETETVVMETATQHLEMPPLNEPMVSDQLDMNMLSSSEVDVVGKVQESGGGGGVSGGGSVTQQLSVKQLPLVLNGLSLGEAQKVIENSESSILYTIETHDGFKHSSTSIYELWAKVFEAVQLARQAHNMPPLPMTSLDMISNIQLLGLKTNGLRYLVEQMPGAVKCTKYKPTFNVQLINKDDKSEVGSPVHKKGAVRMMPYHGERKPYDMFGWLTSKHRRPDFVEEVYSRKVFSTSASISARYRMLKETCKIAVGVYPSDIHGRGLFAKIVIESGDMVIEYAGEVIRSVLTDKREKYYNSKGIGCYMFRIDEDLVVDSTMKGNSARFINHSCDPNCYSKVVEIQGHKHIIIFALRRILCGEELTYDYKFPIEDDKIPCTCGTKRCRKFLN